MVWVLTVLGFGVLILGELRVFAWIFVVSRRNVADDVCLDHHFVLQLHYLYNYNCRFSVDYRVHLRLADLSNGLDLQPLQNSRHDFPHRRGLEHDLGQIRLQGQGHRTKVCSRPSRACVARDLSPPPVAPA